MNNSERQWFKQSERPVTEHDCPVWVKYCAAEIFLSRYVLAENGAHPADILWSHAEADIPAPPKKELTQEEKDGCAATIEADEIYEDIDYDSFKSGFRRGAAYAREAARADERARLGKEVERVINAKSWLCSDGPFANDLRALFTESTNNRETK